MACKTPLLGSELYLRSWCLLCWFEITNTNFLDITLNLTTESYKPYQKPNDQPLYIDKYSNHPRHIIKTLPNTISKESLNYLLLRKILKKPPLSTSKQ